MLVKLGFKTSKKRIRATSGVPQGSHLGPLLFLLFLNDLPQYINRSVKFLAYADDLKLYITIKSLADCHLLQMAINELKKFCDIFNLELNISKCYSLSFSRSKALKFNFDYSIDNVQLKKASSIKDLGVTLDSKLQFNEHLNSCVSKSLKMLGFIFRSCRKFKSIRSLKTLYYAYVRSNLEYCSVIWNSLLINQNRVLERVQRKFCRYLFHMGLVPTVHDFHYQPILQAINLPSLESRRKYFDLAFVLKSFYNKIDSSTFLHLFSINNSSRSLRHQHYFTFNPQNQSPINRIMKLFNDNQDSLPLNQNIPYSTLINSIKSICY